jgi:acyl-[acyl carrier protein]--UDP-N-acetylglucosamine O-acyltransferase
MSKKDYGNYNALGNGNMLGNDNTFGNYNTLRDGNTLGNDNTFGNYNAFGDDNVLGDRNKLRNDSTFGDYNTLGDRNRLGNNTTLGDYNTLGHYSSLGDEFRHGKRFSAEGVKVIKVMTAANIDGSGERIHIYVHTKGVLIVGGGFRGTVDEFCAKATAENKTIYADVVRATADAFAASVKRLGLTGGWDE